MLLPDPVEALRVHHRFLDYLHADFHLLGSAAGLAIELKGELGEIPHHEIEDLVHQVVLHRIDRGTFDKQLAVGPEFRYGNHLLKRYFKEK